MSQPRKQGEVKSNRKLVSNWIVTSCRFRTIRFCHKQMHASKLFFSFFCQIGAGVIFSPEVDKATFCRRIAELLDIEWRFPPTQQLIFSSHHIPCLSEQHLAAPVWFAESLVLLVTPCRVVGCPYPQSLALLNQFSQDLLRDFFRSSASPEIMTQTKLLQLEST